MTTTGFPLEGEVIRQAQVTQTLRESYRPHTSAGTSRGGNGLVPADPRLARFEANVASLLRTAVHLAGLIAVTLVVLIPIIAVWRWTA